MHGQIDVLTAVWTDVCSPIDLYMSAGFSIIPSTLAPKLRILSRFHASKLLAQEQAFDDALGPGVRVCFFLTLRPRCADFLLAALNPKLKP